MYIHELFSNQRLVFISWNGIKNVKKSHIYITQVTICTYTDTYLWTLKTLNASHRDTQFSKTSYFSNKINTWILQAIFFVCFNEGVKIPCMKRFFCIFFFKEKFISHLKYLVFTKPYNYSISTCLPGYVQIIKFVLYSLPFMQQFCVVNLYSLQYCLKIYTILPEHLSDHP